MNDYRLHEKRHRKEMRRRSVRAEHLERRRRRYAMWQAGQHFEQPKAAVPARYEKVPVAALARPNIFRRLWHGMTGAA